MSFFTSGASESSPRIGSNLYALFPFYQLMGIGVLSFALAVSSPPAFSQSQSVNINTASPELLSESLSGVGLAKAYRIVEHRESYGPFESIDELVEVKGIGESIIAGNRDRIVLE
ncbi:MAG: helix-hairpin-helix domain-containing protein [Luminiphilus sp.]|nr:helix-hairpin-helix domain-containing protein [Luminiphilus sp.]